MTTTLVSRKVEASAWLADAGRSWAAGPNNLQQNTIKSLPHCRGHITEELQTQVALQHTSAVSRVGLGSENSVGDTGIAAADWHAGLANLWCFLLLDCAVPSVEGDLEWWDVKLKTHHTAAIDSSQWRGNVEIKCKDSNRAALHQCYLLSLELAADSFI